jgi:cellulose synthase/poly-beta-1,6-N-acetylglucosamine synthase-like glycosyltransferase
MKRLNTTVLMPVHGDAPYLAQAINSVLAQTKKEIELLIVFDRPGQQAVETVEKFQSADERIRSIHSTAPGISAALNYGFVHSNTPFIARLDCDDVMHHERLERQESILLDEGVVCVGSQLRIMDVNGRTVRYTHYPTRYFEIESSLRIRNVVAHPSVMFRKKAVIDAGGYRSEFNGSEDYDLWIRLSRIGRIVNINQVLTDYRIHQNQTSSRNKETQLQLDANVRKSNFTRLKDKPGLVSALLINEAINSSGISRISRMILATFANPLVVISFLTWQFVPEVFSNDK